MRTGGDREVESPDGTGTAWSNRVHNPIFQRRIKQFPEYGEAQRAIVYQRLERMDHELDGHEFIAGDRFTIADITALVAIDFGRRLAEIQIPPRLTHLTRWHEKVSKRASAKA
jgi:glutathione S-transferase